MSMFRASPNPKEEGFRLFETAISDHFAIFVGFEYMFGSAEEASEHQSLHEYVKIRWNNDKGELDIRIQENPYYTSVGIKAYSMLVTKCESTFTENEKELHEFGKKVAPDTYQGIFEDKWLTEEQFRRAVREFEPDAVFDQWVAYEVCPYSLGYVKEEHGQQQASS